MVSALYQNAFIGLPLPLSNRANGLEKNSTADASGWRCCLNRGAGDTSGLGKTRREVLFATAGALLAGYSKGSRAAWGAPTDGKGCKECCGTGNISCELCKGTGFWKALMGNDEMLNYKGVECPECDGTGNITCSVCLGTGEGNVRGLLRRREVAPGKGRILQS